MIDLGLIYLFDDILPLLVVSLTYQHSLQLHILSVLLGLLSLLFINALLDVLFLLLLHVQRLQHVDSLLDGSLGTVGHNDGLIEGNGVAALESGFVGGQGGDSLAELYNVDSGLLHSGCIVIIISPMDRQYSLQQVTHSLSDTNDFSRPKLKYE